MIHTIDKGIYFNDSKPVKRPYRVRITKNGLTITDTFEDKNNAIIFRDKVSPTVYCTSCKCVISKGKCCLNCKDDYSKQYLNINRKSILDNNKAYYSKNRSKLLKNQREYCSDPVNYSTYLQYMTIDEDPLNVNGKLSVRCFNCKERYLPSMVSL